MRPTRWRTFWKKLERDIKLRPTFFQIWWSFLKVGAMLFGGGYAMLPLLEREIIQRRGWCTTEEMTDFYAMAQLVPGVIAVNTSMLVGHRLRGFAGTVIATFGVVFVPFLLILCYAVLYDQISHLSYLEKAMAGLRPAVAGMMAGISWTMFRRTGKTRFGIAVTGITLFLVRVLKISAVTVILAGFFGTILYWLFLNVWRKRK